VITLLFTIFLIIVNKIKIGLEFDLIFWKKILVETLPLLGMAILTTIYLNNDTILIGRFFGPEKVGFYQSAYKILFAFQSVNVINNALFPRFSALIHQKKYQSLDKLIKFTLFWSLLVLVPLAIVITIFAKPIINIIYGSIYSSASLALTLLIWTGVVSYFKLLASNLLIASNHQKSFFYIFLFGTIINVAINITITPHYNYFLPALSLLISETLITFLATILYVRIKK
jgi:O-antigen/teichoic acid export membrane protein